MENGISLRAGGRWRREGENEGLMGGRIATAGYSERAIDRKGRTQDDDDDDGACPACCMYNRPATAPTLVLPPGTAAAVP